MRLVFLIMLVSSIVMTSQVAGASHRPDCAQSHDYFVADDAFVNSDPENRDFGVVDYIELRCAQGWDHWPRLAFETIGTEPCWWLSFESPRVVNLTIGTACITPPHIAVSTAGVVHVS